MIVVILEGGGVRRGEHGVIHRQALRHVVDVVLLQAQFPVPVQGELDRLSVARLCRFLELQHVLVKRMRVVELTGPLQLDGLRQRRCRGGGERHPQRHSQDTPDGLSLHVVSLLFTGFATGHRPLRRMPFQKIPRDLVGLRRPRKPTPRRFRYMCGNHPGAGNDDGCLDGPWTIAAGSHDRWRGG